VSQHRILLVIGGGIAAYKCLELIRRAREQGIAVRAVMTRAAQEFVTPLSVAALTGERVYADLFNLDDEHEIGHIRLSREADLIVVAPATADLLAKMAGGHADDLATAVLLATDKPVLAAPAMNPRMWAHPATRRNVARLQADGIVLVGPNAGEMAERGEAGMGRMSEPHEILAASQSLLRTPAARHGNDGQASSLQGRHVLITAGPTHEPIDPVRYIANRSSGKQGYALAAAARALGARVTLVAGPTNLPAPRPCRRTSHCLPPPSPIGGWRTPAPRRSRRVPRRHRRSSRWSRTPISSRRSPTRAPACGLPSSSVLPPRPRTSSITRSASARRRAAIGSSPTTSALRQGSWAAIAIACI
jgi:phosphopantothenoylcysteine decarboxylase/phosphopantothenate--cysteine ligase